MAEEGCKVFLMTTEDRYQQCRMDFESDHVRFYLDKDGDNFISQDLPSSRVTSIDLPNKKLLCPSKRHYGLTLGSEAGIRKLYFLTYDQMQDGVRRILNAQNFQHRIRQYKDIRHLPDNQLGERKIVKHRLTGEKFVLKTVPHNS